MESERFEALIDAILAIIITLIVMEIPFPSTTSIYSLIELYPDFIAYALSFIICFNVWNYHHNLFNIVNKINSKITWSSGISIMILGLLPHVTSMVANNFYSFTAQAFFGLIFVLTNLNIFIVDYILTRIDKANIALIMLFERNIKYQKVVWTIFILGYVIGYLFYPPAIIISCIISVLITINVNS